MQIEIYEEKETFNQCEVCYATNDNFLESLDEDTGADVFTEPTETMKKASLDFVKTVLSEYPRYELEMIKAKTIKIKDYI